MMATNFSAEQLQAIEAKGNVIVSAGAGSGKTTVMVERIVKKLLEGSKLDRMLIVTFTRASAADIRVKLAERLTALKSDGGKSRDVAVEALESLPVCNIGTLHSFCQRLIRAYYYAAGLDPSAAICDDDESKSLKADSIKRAVRAARIAGDTATCTMLDALSGRRDDNGAIETIEGILDFALSLSNTRDYLSEVENDSDYYGIYEAELALQREGLIKEAKLLNADIAAVNFTKIARAAADLFGYIDHGFEVSKTSYSGKDQNFKALYERFKALKMAIGPYRKNVAFVEGITSVESAPFARALCAVALDALDRFEAKKAALGKIDYSDLEHGALKVLSDGDCMAEIAHTIDFVFIDEYQDVNPLQATIAARLKDGAKAEMFLVGDIKQSIYAFRRCNPRFFMEALEDKDYTKVLLNRNYRSSTEVIGFINKVFDGVMRPDFGGADYSVDKLICGNPKSGSAEFYSSPAPTKSTKTEVEDEPPYSVMAAPKGAERVDDQAQFIVNRILEYVENGEGDFGSIAVLMRSINSTFCDKLISLMRANGIPCKNSKKSRASDYPEILALLGIARCIDNRFDDVALYTALRSSMGGFTDEELLEIANVGRVCAEKKGVAPECGFSSSKKTYYFWQKANAYVGKHSKRLNAFFERRESLSEYAKRHDAADALGRLTSEIDFFQYVFENGGNASAVEALIAVAASKKCTLSAFLNIAEKVELDAGDGGDAVTVTTIHSSKGLEFDFVIVADIGSIINKKGWTKKCMTADGGIAVKYPDAVTRTLKTAARWQMATQLVPRSALAEELRLFYVALTRAKKKLVVVGLKPSKEHPPEEAVYMYDFMKNITDPKKMDATQRDVDDEEEEEDSVDKAIVEAVRERINGAYVPKDIPIKTCVTAIAERTDDGDYTAFAPVLTYDDRDGSGQEQKGGLKGEGDAARRGTAYHRAMELIDFEYPDVEKVKSEMDDGELVDFDVILKAAAEMKKLTAGAKAYYKERYFIADMPIEGENTLVQGVIDLLILNADGTATIVDYKTTAPAYLKSDNYLKQLSLYAAAVEKSSPFKVTATYLYSFALSKSIRCNRAE